MSRMDNLASYWENIANYLRWTVLFGWMIWFIASIFKNIVLSLPLTLDLFPWPTDLVRYLLLVISLIVWGLCVVRVHQIGVSILQNMTKFVLPAAILSTLFIFLSNHSTLYLSNDTIKVMHSMVPFATFIFSVLLGVQNSTSALETFGCVLIATICQALISNTPNFHDPISIIMGTSSYLLGVAAFVWIAYILLTEKMDVFDFFALFAPITLIFVYIGDWWTGFLYCVSSHGPPLAGGTTLIYVVAIQFADLFFGLATLFLPFSSSHSSTVSISMCLSLQQVFKLLIQNIFFDADLYPCQFLGMSGILFACWLYVASHPLFHSSLYHQFTPSSYHLHSSDDNIASKWGDTEDMEANLNRLLKSGSATNNNNSGECIDIDIVQKDSHNVIDTNHSNNEEENYIINKKFSNPFKPSRTTTFQANPFKAFIFSLYDWIIANYIHIMIAVVLILFVRLGTTSTIIAIDWTMGDLKHVVKGDALNNAVGLDTINESLEYFPKFTTTERDDYLKSLKDIRFAILATKSLHHRVAFQFLSWVDQDVLPYVSVYSEVADDEMHHLPNIVKTNCTNDYADSSGVWCKETEMFDAWKNDSKYADVKWFYLANDDSYVHVENLVWLTKQFDHNENVVIGHKLCYAGFVNIVVGGAGTLISRGYVQALNYSVWRTGLKNLHTTRGDTLTHGDASISFTGFLTGTRFVHYPGFFNFQASEEDDEAYRYTIRQIGHPWPLTIRPIAYHEVDEAERMMKIHRELHAIDYSNVSKYPVEIPWNFPCPYCSAVRHVYKSCTFRRDEECWHGTSSLYCLGYGPWPNS